MNQDQDPVITAGLAPIQDGNTQSLDTGNGILSRGELVQDAPVGPLESDPAPLVKGQGAGSPAASEEDLVPVDMNDMNTFLQMLMGWHEHQVALVNHLLEIPEDTEIDRGEGTERITLSGDLRKGLIMGVQMALGYLGELPFVAEFQEEPESQETTQGEKLLAEISQASKVTPFPGPNG